MIDTERREAARQFINRWRGKGKEDEDGRSYWIELLSNIFGVENVTERIDFEKKVVVDGHTKRIDVYIPETKVIIEQKSLNVPLDKKVRNSGEVDLTAFEQADRYNSKLIFDERARWIVTCNFAEIWIYDMNERQPKPSKIMLEELQTKYSLLDFLIKKEVQKISHEMEVSIKAGEIVGLIYNAFLEQYKIPKVKKNETEVEKEKREHKLKSLNALCVRLVFCLYAEDAGIFGGKRNMFHDYLARYEARDCRRALIELFKVLDTKEEEREDYLEEDLAQFPYVNGGLFADETIEIPQFTEKIRELLLTKASEKFNWRDISPTIFGAVFESTLNPETRRSGGMHYTSIENIHKVIDPLFLDELQEEFETIQAYKTLDIKRKRLMDFQEKLAHLKFLDPACGSGNFLTETYLSLRRLENKVLQVLFGEGQGVLGIAASDIIKVSIQQFYGIEINDFAVTVAKTALWIAESQMLEETKNIIYGLDGDFLPLKTYVNITEDNALRIDWNDVISADELNYIMGNPPFVGYAYQSKEQKEDLIQITLDMGKVGKNIDYVAGWYFKASKFMANSLIKTAFVSTNSITQGEQVSAVWQPMYKFFNIHIDFAYRTFRWDSEANLKAHVHCVIIGFSCALNSSAKVLYTSDSRQLTDNFRLNSKKAATRIKANTPMLFDEIHDSSTDYVEIPKVSSERRRYIPMDYVSSDVISGDKLFMMPNASLYHFGVLNSNVHMAWMRAVGGRLKSDYSYSNTIVYNNFPWPTSTDQQREKIEQTARKILDARELYPDSSLADLYDPLTMPPELLKAHTENNKVVMAAYGFTTKMSEEDCVAELMKLYQKLIKAEKRR